MNRTSVASGLLALCLLALVPQARAEAAVDALLAKLAGISHLQGEFRQRQYGEDGSPAGESRGVFALLRPVWFRWEIQAPDRQLIIAGPEYLWHYDMDLETVTRRPVVGSVETSPLQVLAGDEAVLREQFSVERGEGDSFILVPTAGEHGFRRLQVNFDGDTIAGMEILDTLGQRLVVDFTQVDAATALTESDFDFNPPPAGVDLFYYDQ